MSLDQPGPLSTLKTGLPAAELIDDIVKRGWTRVSQRRLLWVFLFYRLLLRETGPELSWLRRVADCADKRTLSSARYNRCDIR